MSLYSPEFALLRAKMENNYSFPPKYFPPPLLEYESLALNKKIRFIDEVIKLIINVNSQWAGASYFVNRGSIRSMLKRFPWISQNILRNINYPLITIPYQPIPVCKNWYFVTYEIIVASGPILHARITVNFTDPKYKPVSQWTQVPWDALFNLPAVAQLLIPDNTSLISVPILSAYSEPSIMYSSFKEILDAVNKE